MIAGAPDRAMARRSDPSTSHAAAAAITKEMSHIQVSVLRYAVRRGDAGFIDPELQENFADNSSTYRTRRGELVSAGLIENSGDRRQRGGRGRFFIVWRITQAGRAEMERQR